MMDDRLMIGDRIKARKEARNADADTYAPTANGTTLVVAEGAKVFKNDVGGVMIGDRLAQMVGGSKSTWSPTILEDNTLRCDSAGNCMMADNLM
jgi:hypothetical protein